MAGGAGWGAAASAAASVHEAFINAKASTDISKFQTQFASDTNVINRAREDTRMQRAVADAKAAGLHPLFALGSAGAGSASMALGPTPTGSVAGTGIARAGEAIERGIRGVGKAERTTRLDAAAKELHDLRLIKASKEIQLDDAQLMKMASDLKLSEQQNLYWGQAYSGGITSTGGPESMTIPFRNKAGIPLNQSPITNTSRRSEPGWVEMKGPKGRRMIRDQRVFGDEIAQADTAVRPWLDYSQSYRRKFAPSMKNPAAYYYYWKNYYRNRNRRK